MQEWGTPVVQPNLRLDVGGRHVEVVPEDDSVVGLVFSILTINDLSQSFHSTSALTSCLRSSKPA